MERFLIVNPRSGTALRAPTSCATPRRAAASRSTSSGRATTSRRSRGGATPDVLGMAGGDGSLAAVAEVAIEQDMPFVCIPFGTRNHFARDVGLDRDDPIGALDGLRRRGAADRRRPRRRPALPEQRLARPLRAARAPARAPPPPARRARAPAGARADRARPPPAAALHDRRRAGARAARARREQRLQPRPALARRARAARRRAAPPVRPARASAASPGTSGAARSSSSDRR